MFEKKIIAFIPSARTDKIEELIKNLENEIEQLQSKLDELQVEITKENVYSDYNLMNDFCLEIDNIKNKINEKFDEWANLSDE